MRDDYLPLVHPVSSKRYPSRLESRAGFFASTRDECLSPRVRLECNPEIPVAPGGEPWLLDTSLDEVYWPCSHSRAIPSLPSQLEWKIGLACACEAAESAGSWIRESWQQAKKIYYKSAIDLVTTVDRQAEERIVHILEKYFPDHSILAEEETAIVRSKSDYRWIIDPLDG